MPQEVFVSYSQADRETALALVSYLEAHGFGCWVAPRDVAPSSDWAAEIIAAIAAARVMVLVFSASANSSPQVRREVERAVHRDVAVLPVRIEDVLPSQSLEYFLSSQHWLDAFPPPMEPHFARLGTYLMTLLGRAARPAVAPCWPVRPRRRWRRAGRPPRTAPRTKCCPTRRHCTASKRSWRFTSGRSPGTW